jgi:hypothetical protein
LNQTEPTLDEMEVCVDEAGHHEAASEVDLSGVAPACRGIARPDVGDTAVFDDEPRRVGLLGAAGEDGCVDVQRARGVGHGVCR